MDYTLDFLRESPTVEEIRTASVPTGVVTFLLSDVEGSTRLWEGDEELMRAAIVRHYELLDTAIELHGGVRPVEQGEGDSVVGAFSRPSDAIAAAVDVQRAFAQEPWPEGAALRIRLALHTGVAQVREEGYYVGRAVIRCARLRATAHGGQTVLSAATRDLVADRLPSGVTLRDLGPHRLKDLGQPERVWQLCHPDLVNEFPPLRSLNAVANNLPAQLTSFVGRDRELGEVDQTLQDARLVTLIGAGVAVRRVSPSTSLPRRPNATPTGCDGSNSNPSLRRAWWRTRWPAPSGWWRRRTDRSSTRCANSWPDPTPW
jgi:class 3 adenylate cyclase